MKKTFTFVLVTITVVLFTVVAFMSHTRTAGPLFAMNVEALARNNGSNGIWGWDVTNECLHCDIEQVYVCCGHPSYGSGRILGYYPDDFEVPAGRSGSIEGELGTSGVNVGGSMIATTKYLRCCILTPDKYCDFTHNQEPDCDRYLFDHYEHI